VRRSSPAPSPSRPRALALGGASPPGAARDAVARTIMDDVVTAAPKVGGAARHATALIAA
jgi:hypothetical protein